MEEILNQIEHLNPLANIPFYQKVDFCISSFIRIIGVIFSYVAYIEAKKAKEAAKEAGQFVKIQSLTIDPLKFANARALNNITSKSVDCFYSGGIIYFSSADLYIASTLS